MLIIWKFPKSIACSTKRPRGPHAARVWDPSSNTTKQKKQDHTSLVSKLAKQTS